jgi:hypothetical protein
MTLSNPVGMNFTPACAPVVLKRIEEDTSAGFIRPTP